MSLTPEQHAAIAQEAQLFVQQVSERTGLPPAGAVIGVAVLAWVAWLVERNHWQRDPEHRFEPHSYVVGLLNALWMAALGSWGVYYALDTARLFCLPGEGSRYCGDTFVDAGGMHDHFDNLVSIYTSPSAFLFWLALVAGLAWAGWYGLFATWRGLVDRWRERRRP